VLAHVDGLLVSGGCGREVLLVLLVAQVQDHLFLLGVGVDGVPLKVC